jgi:hypothetical protein
VVHFLNKGGGYLGEDLHGEERGRERSDGQITSGDAAFKERRVKE